MLQTQLPPRFSDFIAKQKTLTVPVDFFHDRFPYALALCRSVLDSKPELQGDPGIIVKERLSKLSSVDSFTVLASGGADSSYLLYFVRNLYPSVAITAISALTKNNSKELNFLAAVCKTQKIDLIVATPTEERLIQQLRAFESKASRLPNDCVQPLHNYLVMLADRLNPGSVILDGQYADTLMFANPQNIFFDVWLLTKLYRVDLISKLAFRFLDNSPGLMPGQTSTRDFFKSTCLSAPEVIAWLCRLSTDHSVIGQIQKGLKDFPARLLFQSIFYTILLEYREKDKYFLAPHVVTPFNDMRLMVDAWHYKSFYSGISIRKKPIWDYLNKNKLKGKHFFKRRSFEPV
jgi:hypothetical protein